ncbi:MAG: DUF3090 domain-containing protein [Candidatus Thermofonsia Clade 1 bacterium]|jgi:uncharacterized repeat protein (TIGR03847 family)|uniref:DUF3090 domain-containing protein n=1 Tax=Candidatus Thermofonsia Clade 1 bacterium TaxID=2364210 RepID=A0A2M8PFA3_9CHLR|nr:MAG: DUF3090 domain-containing protein [Candidatus Thermofonsia Clade 1 bacterium]
MELELDPIEFVTIGTVGPRGRRVFYLQAGYHNQLISLIIEKEQARAIAESLREMLDELKSRNSGLSDDTPDMARMNMNLRDPIEARFRVARIGIGYNQERDRVLLVVQEQVDEGRSTTSSVSPSVVRIWGTRLQMRALSLHTMDVVKQGRPNPSHNGHILNYWI